MSQLTTTQKLALTLNKNIAVTAGAGTGKTLILVERYLDTLIHEDIDIKEILAITFTNKAAAEMMECVAQRMEELIGETEDEKLKRRLIEYRNHISSGYISTIHSFCARILHEYPMQAGLDPDYTQLNDIQSELIIEEAIEEELEIINSQENQWLDLFRLFGTANIKQMLRMSLAHRFEMTGITKTYQIKDADQIFSELVAIYKDMISRKIDNKIVDQIYILVGEILGRDLNNTHQFESALPVLEGLKTFYTTEQGSLDYWQRLLRLSDLFTTQKGTAYHNLNHLGGERAWDKIAKEKIKNLSLLLAEIAQLKLKFPLTHPGALDRSVIEMLGKYYLLYQQVEKRYEEKKDEQAAVDYDDLQLRVLRLLQDDKNVRQRIAGQFKYILVDEFQDTNFLQWEIISALGEIAQQKFFIVGDPKQSIYGFRDADVRVFNEVKTLFIKKDTTSDISLQESFRFKEELNSFINHTFQNILIEEVNNPWAVGYQSLKIHRDDAEGGRVELALLQDDEEEKNQAQFIAYRIKLLKSETNYRYGDFAVLLRTRNHLNEVEEALRKNEIPFKTVGGIGFYQRQEIYDIYHLIRFLINPHEDIALIALLRSPVANISDEALFFLAVNDRHGSYWERIGACDETDNFPQQDMRNLLIFRSRAKRWLNRRDRIGFTELLSEIFNDSLYRAILSASLNGTQLLANIDKILELSHENERSGFTSLNDFAESLKKLINTQVKEGEAQTDLEDESTVKIMTIHQAKGLEFPIVFLPYLEQKLLTNRRKTVLFDEKMGLVAGIRKNAVPKEIEINESYYLLELLRHRQNLKEIAELKRLFYVGCTRAKDHLILTAGKGEKEIAPDTPLFWLLNALHADQERLEHGKWEYDPEKEIMIWIDYDIQEESIKKGYTIRSSLQKLGTIVEKPKRLKETPYQLRSLLDQPRGEIFSATQIMVFLQDKEEYYRRYHLGFFEGDYDRIIIGHSDEELALLKGKLIHRYMEAYPNFNLENALFDLEISNTQVLFELQEEINKIADRTKKSSVLQHIFSAVKYKNEIQILMQLDSDYITGTLDRIFLNENDEWEVLDYKTNKIISHQVVTTAKKYQTQMEVYALLVASIYPSQKRYPISLYFTEPDQIYQYTFSTAELNKIRQKVMRVIKSIKQLPPYGNERKNDDKDLQV